MNEDTIARLNQISEQLHKRAMSLSHPGQDEDMAALMSALAVTMEAVRSIGVVVNRLDGRPAFERS